MPIYLNTTKVGSNAYDVHSAVSTKLNKIKMGSADVWSGVPPIYNTVKNATSAISQSDWIEFVNSGCAAMVVANNDISSFLNKKVTINTTFSSGGIKNIWTIADFNHDSAAGAVDLIQTQTIFNQKFNSNNYNGQGIIYASSEIRTWLINTYLPTLDASIRNILKNMSISSNETTLNDKIKLLSGTEVGLSSGSMLTEGVAYPIFTSDSTRVRTGTSSYWWLRSRVTSANNMVWMIDESGRLSGEYYNATQGTVPCIRF